MFVFLVNEPTERALYCSVLYNIYTSVLIKTVKLCIQKHTRTYSTHS